MENIVFNSRLRDFLPPVLFRLKRSIFGWRWFSGRYDTWEMAKVKTSGYDEPSILAKVLWATLEVKAGRAAYERDSVLFDVLEFDEALLSCLLQVAAEKNGRLRVLDFGGSLGSAYWQHRKAFSGLAEVRWDVVEQPHFVEAGRRFLQDAQLKFFESIDVASRACSHDVLLASSVLQYLPSPHLFLDELVAREMPAIVLHNLPLHSLGADYLRVERVPPEIYPATYPMWFLNQHMITAHFEGHYELERIYSSPAIWWSGWKDYKSTGLFLRRIPRGTP